MSLVRLHILSLVAVAALVVGCGGSQKPQLRVLGVEQSERAYDGRQLKLFVEVTNYAKRPMRLQRLQYVFGPSGTNDVSGRGEVALARTVEAGSAVVVEVPILVDPSLLSRGPLELRGNLITAQDEIVRSYPVRADVHEPRSDAPERLSTEPPPQ